MKLGNTGIDHNAEVQQGNYEPLPKGKYRAQLTNIEVTEKESGAIMVDLESEILSEPYQNRKVWTSINIKKKDGDINAIGNGQISALAKACGKDSIPHDEQVLLGIPHIVSLAIETQPGYEPKNVMKGFFPLESAGKQELQKKVKEQGAFDARNLGATEDDSMPDFLR